MFPEQTLIFNCFPGQGIPTGQAGHLLVKTETGQYQIVKVGGAVSNSNVVSSPQIIRTTAVPRVTAASAVAAISSPAAPVPQPAPAAPPNNVTSVASSSGTTNTNSSSSSGGGGMGGNQMTPDTAKHKCKNFLATLLKLAGEQPANVAANVRNLIQGLIDGKVDPETFTTKLQRELNSSPQPCLVPFLKRSLPFLQASLTSGELSIEGVRAPPPKLMTTGPPASVLKGPVNVRPPSVALPTRPVSTSVMRTMTPNVLTPNLVRTAAGATRLVQNANLKPPFMTATSNNLVRVGALSSLQTAVNSSAQPQLSQQQHPPPQVVREKKTSNSYSVAGDEDINDVAAMGGVNLAEESQRMQGTIMVGSQIRSCKDETFLQTGLLQKRVAKICLENGLDEPSAEVIALVSHATQDRLKSLLEKLSVISEHRLDLVRQEGDYTVTQDVRGQLRFLGELDKLERRRHEEAERELLLRAAKSRTKTEDPEKEKLKAKAKELQRFEEEQARHEMANNTALMAIGGPHKKLKLDELGSSGSAAGASSSSMTASSNLGNSSLGPSSFTSRPRMKRVHVRDLLFLMEQEKELKRSPLLWKAHCS